MSAVTPKMLTQNEVDEQFDMSLYDPINGLDRNRVIFFDGDATITGDLDSDWAVSVLEQLGEDTSLNDVLVMVNGNLTVEGDIAISDYHPILLVVGKCVLRRAAKCRRNDTHNRRCAHQISPGQ